MRATGKDFLRLRRDPAAKSYWIDRTPPGPPPQSMKTNSDSERTGTMGSILVELWAFMRERKKFWLLPILIMMVIFGGLIVLTKGSAIAPFVYTLF